MAIELTHKEQQSALEDAIDAVNTCYDSWNQRDPKSPEVLAFEVVDALQRDGFQISKIEHVWSKRTKAGKEQCANCGLIQLNSMSGNRLIVRTFYRGNKYVGDDLPGPIPPCERKASKK